MLGFSTGDGGGRLENWQASWEAACVPRVSGSMVESWVPVLPAPTPSGTLDSIHVGWSPRLANAELNPKLKGSIVAFIVQ